MKQQNTISIEFTLALIAAHGRPFIVLGRSQAGVFNYPNPAEARRIASKNRKGCAYMNEQDKHSGFDPVPYSVGTCWVHPFKRIEDETPE